MPWRWFGNQKTIVFCSSCLSTATSNPAAYLQKFLDYIKSKYLIIIQRTEMIFNHNNFSKQSMQYQ
jgi:hypothetical protein